MWFLIAYAIGGVLVSGTGVALVAAEDGQISVVGLGVAFLFWPFVVVALIVSGMRAIK